MPSLLHEALLLLFRNRPTLASQLSADPNKRFAWPAYVANLRAQLECPVCLLVVAADEHVARWASKTIEMGGSNYFTPLVLSPADVPEIFDENEACKHPELAVLSAIAHRHDRGVDTFVRITRAVQKALSLLEDDRSKMYHHLVDVLFRDTLQQELQVMPMTTEQLWNSDRRRSELPVQPSLSSTRLRIDC